MASYRLRKLFCDLGDTVLLVAETAMLYSIFISSDRTDLFYVVVSPLNYLAAFLVIRYAMMPRITQRLVSRIRGYDVMPEDTPPSEGEEEEEDDFVK